VLCDSKAWDAGAMRSKDKTTTTARLTCTNDY
jgi:hypothetical protein